LAGPAFAVANFTPGEILLTRQCSVFVCATVLLVAASMKVADAQSSRSLSWNESSSSTVSGFAVTIDGARTDYGVAPAQSDGSCACSIALPFSSGRHTLIVSAYNSSGETASAPLIVGPTADAGGPYSIQAGSAVSVSGARSTDATGTITAYVWSWGDGTPDTTSTSPTASHTYAATGTFTIRLLVSDNFPATHSATTTVTVAASTPGTPGSPAPANGASAVSATPTLSWSASGATSYDVRFGSTAPPPFVINTANAFYSPTTLIAGSTYYWQIVAWNNSGVTSGPVWSFTAATAPVSGLPSPWQTLDIGAVGLAGSAVYSAGQFTLKGAGANIWGTADAFRYLYQPFSGDGQIVARVNRIDNTSPYAKAGIMLRDTLTAGSAHVILDVKPDGGVEFMQRSTDSGGTAYLGGTTVSFPVWLRLVRTSSSVSAAVSSNGSQWTTIGNATVGGTGSGLIGLPVTSQTAATLAAATFDQVVVTAGAPAPPAAPAPANGATGVSNSPTLSWSSEGATSYDVRFGTSNPPPTVVTGQTANTYAPPGPLSAGSTYYWQIVAGNNSGSTSGPVWSFTAATAAPVSGLPSPWQTLDIGAVGLPGSAVYSAGQFTLKGAGADIWGTADAFRYLYQPFSGDGQIVARVSQVDNTHPYAKAGIMLRDTLTAGSAHVILDVKPDGGIEFLQRSAAGGVTTSLGGAAVSFPIWLRLVRTGSSVSAAVSSNGSQWNTIGNTTAGGTGSGFIGLPVTSHTTATLAAATFDQVVVAAGAPAP
jgi:hypothetical protein